ncbi:MAG: acetyl-CoA synthetase [Anaerolinea sp.]|nr:acetyl-CoA synthetase [Anaerolinea sp.]
MTTRSNTSPPKPVTSGRHLPWSGAHVDRIAAVAPPTGPHATATRPAHVECGRITRIPAGAFARSAILINEATVTFQSVLAQARAEGRTLLNEVEAKELLREAGVPATAATLATSRDQAQSQADAMGYPVVLKVVSQDIAHKSDVGGVKLNLQDRAAVGEAFDAIMTSAKAAEPNARIAGVSVQQMAKQGTEVIVGMTTDPQFGPVLMFGLGGIMVEVLKDVSFRLVPLEAKDADQMISEIKGKPILDGVRGQPPSDLAALRNTILKVSEFVQKHPEVRELDLNPVFAYPDGALAVDARIVVSEA